MVILELLIHVSLEDVDLEAFEIAKTCQNLTICQVLAEQAAEEERSPGTFQGCSVFRLNHNDP